jgi:hypothetical protein
MLTDPPPPPCMVQCRICTRIVSSGTFCLPTSPRWHLGAVPGVTAWVRIAADMGRTSPTSETLSQMGLEVEPVPDEELERLARERGLASIEARVLSKLRLDRAGDRQVYAFRAGDYYFTGPAPDAKTEATILGLAEDG